MKNKMLVGFFILVSIINLSMCSFFSNSSVEENKEKITGLSFKKTALTIENGSSEYLLYTVTPTSLQNTSSATWAYDNKIIEIDPDRYGVVIKPKKSGQTYLKATINGITATCLITVSGNPDIYEGNPYIYSNFTVVELTPGSTTTVSASLYGGNSSDLEAMIWQIKDPSIAELSYARGSCVIKAKRTGSTQITVKHPKSEYSYSMILFVYTDELNEPYLTTNQNIVVINKTETITRNISVDIKNPYSTSKPSDYSYEVITNNGGIPSFSVVGNGNTAILTAENNGLSILRVTHVSCTYPLDILVKVTTTVENVYVVPSCSTLEVIGSNTPYNVFATLTGTTKYDDPEKYTWFIENEEAAKDLANWEFSGNCFSVIGKKNGAFKVKVGHELSEYSRSILVVLRQQEESAIDATMYITTTANFVQTQVGADTSCISVSLMGGKPGDENNLVWTIDNGENNDICKILTPTGQIKARTQGNVANGTLYITPNKAGKTTITVSHPKILYDTEIIVKVLSEYAITTEPAYINSESVIKMLNGTTQEVTATLSGNSIQGDENGILWESKNNAIISVSPETGKTTVLTAKGAGNNQTYVSVKHPKALSEKKILVLSAQTQEALDTMKGIFSDTSYYRINEDANCTLSLQSYGIEESEKKNIKWTTSDSAICTVSANSSDYLNATVTGIKSGKTTVKASFLDSEPCIFEITVLPKGETTGVVKSSYLTTLKNAIVIPSIGKTGTLEVSGINISEYEMNVYTQWEIEDPSIASVSYIAGSATITALKEGKTRVKITNTISENDLFIDIKVGALFEWVDDFVVYITTEKDVITMIKGNTATIGAALENSTQKNGFSWSVSGGSTLVDIAGSTNGFCVINALEAGMAEITIYNTATQINKQILIIISNTQEELEGIKYLSTKQNVVSIGESYNSTVSVSVENAKTNILDGFHWSSSDSSIVTVVSSGSTAVFYGKKQGTAKITVTNDQCDYPLEIIANIIDPVLAAANPYISCQNIITLHVGDNPSTLIADLIGGKESDYNNFTWQVQNSSIASLYSSNQSAQIKAVSVGVTQVIISHPKANGVDRSILVICEPQVNKDCYITVTESIIKMSPTDSSKTITATLVNGKDNDNYNFKWWADSYDIIDMNYTSESAIITPIGSGSTTLHISHPKATGTKDIILTISKYSEFAFEGTSTTVTAGKQTFVNMQVPVTNVATKISYSAKKADGTSASNLLAVNGTNSVCILDPRETGTCIVTANLIAINTGIVQASCQLLVNIQAAQTQSTYINYTGSTIVNIEKGASQKLSATLAGVKATQGSKVQWKSSDPNIIKLSSASNSGIFTGNEVQINALQSGKECTITIFHEDADFDVILYCIVPGENVANILLDRSKMNLIQGDSTQSLTASITNAQEKDYENLVWTVEQNEAKPAVLLSGSGKKISLLPKNVGTATITATVPSSARVATCTVIVKEPKSIKFENTSLSVYPGEKFTVKYTVTPASETDSIVWTTSNNSYFSIYTDDHNGTLTCLAKTKEGVAQLTGTTKSKATASCNIYNEWGNMFTVEKTLIKTIPINNNDGTFDVKYQIKPSCAELHLIVTQPYLEVANATKVEATKYIIYANQHEQIDPSTGFASGTIHFNPVKETNGTVIIQAYNPTAFNGGSPLGEIEGARKEIAINASYNKLNFYLSKISSDGKYSRIDTNAGILIIGDGENPRLQINNIEVNANPTITKINFSKNANFNTNFLLKDISLTDEQCKPVQGSNNKQFNIKICDDFKKNNYYHESTPPNDIDAEFNTGVVKLIKAGDIIIDYVSTFDQKKNSYTVPCYLEIRNCACNY